MFVGYNPQAGKTGGNVLGQLLCKGHPRYPYGKKLNGFNERNG